VKQEPEYEFDIALSFAGEDRAVAEQLAELLDADGIRVFYDRYEEAQLWGKDLYQHLQEVYRDKAEYCLIFVSQAYSRKLWTRHELKQAQARAFRENQEYILPVRLDDTEIPGLNATVGYIDLRTHDITTLKDLISKKLFGSDADEFDPEELTWRGEHIDFRGMQVASFWPKKLQRAQEKRTYLVELPRIKYGDESYDYGADQRPCHDCAAIKGEYHDPGCDVEECPVCRKQALGCGCIVE
jgi:TIR domain